jgi:hypothetical protein
MMAALVKAMNVLAISLKSTLSLETGISWLFSMTSIFYVDGETGWLLA